MLRGFRFSNSEYDKTNWNCQKFEFSFFNLFQKKTIFENQKVTNKKTKYDTIQSFQNKSSENIQTYFFFTRMLAIKIQELLNQESDKKSKAGQFFMHSGQILAKNRPHFVDITYFE